MKTECMKQLPEFNKNGDLPIGVHKATVKEILERFGSGTLQRRVVAQRLERIYKLASGTGHLSRFIIFGSFITSKESPNDVDIFLLMENTFDASQIKGEEAIIFDHQAAQNFEGASVFWIRRLAAIGGEESAIEDWQIKRDKTKRGIVEVISYD